MAAPTTVPAWARGEQACSFPHHEASPGDGRALAGCRSAALVLLRVDRRRDGRTDLHQQGLPRLHRRKVRWVLLDAPLWRPPNIETQVKFRKTDAPEASCHAEDRRRQDLRSHQGGMSTKKIGDAILDVKNISLRFGGGRR